MMQEDALISTTTAQTDNIAISWTMGERRIKVSNDRQFRLGITYMSMYQDTVVFNVEGGEAGKPLLSEFRYGSTDRHRRYIQRRSWKMALTSPPTKTHLQRFSGGEDFGLRFAKFIGKLVQGIPELLS